ncbi:MAG: hypothetical protein IKN46_03855, partial [Acholeplasmatales bacterium]|nr:hypothetical protein [Acholeplasmatales bacterium]
EVIEKGNWGDPDYEVHRTILKVGKVFDVALCVNGAYDTTSLQARNKECYEAMEIVKNNLLESKRHISLLKLRNQNKMKLMEVKK